MFKLKWLAKRNPVAEKALVLMYHRIADVNRDPWKLAVSPMHFEQQLALLTEKFTVVSVPELVRQMADKHVAPDSICLTFDDGYADNFHIAKPLLQKYKCPATFFITTQNLINQQAFWWDELERLLLDEEVLPDCFSAAIGGCEITARLGAETRLTALQKHKQNRWVWPQTPTTRRLKLYLRLWKALKPLLHSDIQTELAKIKNWANAKQESKPDLLPMTVGQLQQLAAHPLFHIGIHTLTHPALSSHPYEIQHKEIVENQRLLELCCNRSINTLAFPYGDYNAETLDIVRKHKLAACFSTKALPVTTESNPIDLGRFQVIDRNASALEKQLRYWFKRS